MFSIITLSFLFLLLNISPLATLSSSNPKPPTSHLRSFGGINSKTSSPNLTLKKLIYVHRHGDRTPITPLSDTAFWASTLPDDNTVQALSSPTVTVTDSTVHFPPSLLASGLNGKHKAGGGPVYGMLTSLGILQMISLGSSIGEQIRGELAHVHRGDLSHEDVCVYSTNFPRTILSVQALLAGIFPDPLTSAQIKIDASYTNILIPDPQPRHSAEQVALEKELSDKLLAKRDEEMLGLAKRMTGVLRKENILSPQSFDTSFGVGEDSGGSAGSATGDDRRVLPWSQIAEILKCLHVREKLPSSITPNDLQEIQSHASNRWFTLLRHPRLSALAMSPAVNMLLNIVDDDQHKKVAIISAHDSTIIGLICALRLKNPAVWPEYASYFKVEVYECNDTKRRFLRFSLSGEILECELGKSKGGGKGADHVVDVEIVRAEYEL
jgi:acid phosphatase